MVFLICFLLFVFPLLVSLQTSKEGYRAVQQRRATRVLPWFPVASPFKSHPSNEGNLMVVDFSVAFPVASS